jgi:hypothetical protein
MEQPRALAAKPELAREALSFATVMAFVDGRLAQGKLECVPRLTGKLG